MALDLCLCIACSTVEGATHTCAVERFASSGRTVELRRAVEVILRVAADLLIGTCKILITEEVSGNAVASRLTGIGNVVASSTGNVARQDNTLAGLAREVRVASELIP